MIIYANPNLCFKPYLYSFRYLQLFLQYFLATLSRKDWSMYRGEKSVLVVDKHIFKMSMKKKTLSDYNSCFQHFYQSMKNNKKYVSWVKKVTAALMQKVQKFKGHFS